MIFVVVLCVLNLNSPFVLWLWWDHRECNAEITRNAIVIECNLNIKSFQEETNKLAAEIIIIIISGGKLNTNFNLIIIAYFIESFECVKMKKKMYRLVRIASKLYFLRSLFVQYDSCVSRFLYVQLTLCLIIYIHIDILCLFIVLKRICFGIKTLNFIKIDDVNFLYSNLNAYIFFLAQTW